MPTVAAHRETMMYLSKNRLFVSAFALVLASFLPAAVHAQTPVTLFNDTFSDNNPLQTGSLDMNWYYDGSGSMATVASSPDFALQATPTQPFSEMIGVFNTGSGIVVGQTIGDYVQLSLNVTLGSVPASSGLRMGLYNNAGTPGVANNSSAFLGDFGYRTDNDYSDTGAAILKETGSDTSVPGSGSDGANLLSGSHTGTTLAAATTYTYTFKLARALTGITITSTLLNGASTITSLTTTDTSNPYSTFHEVVVDSGNAQPINYTIDNVTIVQQTSSPEPGSLGLLAITLPTVGIAALRRRKAA